MNKLVLMYTNGKKPFAWRFAMYHKAQAERIGMAFKCVTPEWCDMDGAVIQRPLVSNVKYAGIFEAILQGLEVVPDDTMVYLAEDDCLYNDMRFHDSLALNAAGSGVMAYLMPVSFICPRGYYNGGGGLCLHSSFGPAGIVRENIRLKYEEFNGRRLKPDGTAWPATSVEPCEYPAHGRADAANSCYRTNTVLSTPWFPGSALTLDFRGYKGEQTWKPADNVRTWQSDDVFGDAKQLWDKMIGGQ